VIGNVVDNIGLGALDFAGLLRPRGTGLRNRRLRDWKLASGRTARLRQAAHVAAEAAPLWHTETGRFRVEAVAPQGRRRIRAGSKFLTCTGIAHAARLGHHTSRDGSGSCTSETLLMPSPHRTMRSRSGRRGTPRGCASPAVGLLRAARLVAPNDRPGTRGHKRQTAPPPVGRPDFFVSPTGYSVRPTDRSPSHGT